MTQACTVCSNEKRREIDNAIILGGSDRALSRRFGPSHDAVSRHRAHIADLLAKADAKLGGVYARKITALVERLERMADECDTEKLRGAFLMTVRELRPTYELGAKLTGEMQAASVQGFMAALGVRAESEIRSALDLTRSSELATVDEIEREALEALRMVLGEKPERLLPILSALGGLLPASEAPALESHQANGGGRTATNGGGDGPRA